ncbi:MAG TPA: RsmE family RNA methyltransferase [Kofleriaceae bacterium]|jgi:16S rRNA (uracil1498-N3)-methyltransferase
MIRIFVETLATGSLAIAGDEHHYVGRVRRARVGDSIELVDPAGRRATATIATMTATETTVTVGEVTVAGPVIPRIQVLVPLIKGDRMDACLEKLVEAGVDHLIVWPAERSVVKLDGDKRQARLEHYAAVLAAGARQSGAPAPTIVYASSLRAAVQGLGEGARLVLDGRAERGAAPSDSLITIVSGPEGGLSPGELDLLAGEHFTGFGLGPRVLRAETAPVVAVAILRAATGT